MLIILSEVSFRKGLDPAELSSIPLKLILILLFSFTIECKSFAFWLDLYKTTLDRCISRLFSISSKYFMSTGLSIPLFSSDKLLTELMTLSIICCFFFAKLIALSSEDNLFMTPSWIVFSGVCFASMPKRDNLCIFLYNSSLSIVSVASM